MKKVILFAAILFAGVSVVKAQQSTTSVDVNLTVKLRPFQSISVNPTQKSALIEYSTAEHYWSGASSVEQVDHLKVVAAGGFNVNVNVDGDFKNGTNVIAANTIKVTAEKGTIPLTGAAYTPISLNTSPQALITSDSGTGTGKTFNITYSGAGADAYIEKHLNGQNATDYIAIVTYSIEAK